VNDFDQAARYAAKLDPPCFLCWLLPGLEPGWTFSEWLDTRRLPFPGGRDRTCDTVAALVNPAASGATWAVVIEFQSEPAGDMLARLLDYVGRLNLELRSRAGEYRVAAALLNLTGPEQPDTLAMSLPGMPVYGVRLRAVQRTLRDEDAAGILDDITTGRSARCLLPWIPLMRGAGDVDIMEQWKVAAQAEPDDIRRVEYAELALIFADLAGRAADWKRSLEGWNVRRSQVANEWRAEAVREDIQRAYRVRAQSPMPADLADKLEAITDLGELRRWLDAIVLAGTPDDFRRRVEIGSAAPPTNGR
jgi:hypothetical protein